MRPPTRETPTAFSGTWRIIETELWDADALDTVQPAFIRFDDEMIGSLGMIVIQAGLDCRFGDRDGKPFVELTFEGDDDGHPCTGRAWAKIESDGKLRGRIHIHLGDDSEFVAERAEGATGARSRSKKASKPTKPTEPTKPTKPTKPKKKPSGGSAGVPAPLVFEGALAGLFGGGGRRRGKRSAKADALYQAQQIMYSAWESPDPRRGIALAKQALEISPDCADAYSLLAAHTRDLAEATRLNGLAVEAGMNALGPKAFEEDVGHFWGLVETRPYMRARLALAQCLWEVGDRDDAIAHYRDMLRLNPGDNQGIRYILASCLLETGRDDEVVALLDEYKDDASAAWAWTRALLAFREHGDGAQAKATLAEAKQTNPHVPTYLTGKKKMPKRLPDMIGFGDESEAISYVGDYGSVWKNTPNAIAWAASR